MTEEELQHALESAERSPEMVAQAVSGLDREAFCYKPGPDRWSVLEILAHLADAEIILGYRIRQVIADRDPVFAPINQDDWARHLGYNEADPEELLAAYKINRRANVRLLRRVRPELLSRAGFHPELKRQVTLAEWVERLAKHGPNHLAQIERAKELATRQRAGHATRP